MNAVITWIKGNWVLCIVSVVLLCAISGLLSLGFKLSAAEGLNRKLAEFNRSANIDIAKLDADNKQLAADNQRTKQIAGQLQQSIDIAIRNNIELRRQAEDIRTSLTEAIAIIEGSK